jgi:flagellar basal body P-ring formation protein FlgA
MIRKILFAAAVLAAFGGSATAQVSVALAPVHPKLKAEATVNGDFVRIGDLVANAGIIADVPIFRAPDLGATGMVSAELVVEAVRGHALVGLDTGGIREVAVTRASRTIPTEDIEQGIRHALSTQFVLGDAKDIVLNFDNELKTLYVEPGAKGEPRVAHLTYDNRNGRFYATIELPDGANARASLRLYGRATVTAEVAVLANPVARGAFIKESDVQFERRPRAEIGRDVVTDRAQAVGLAARDALEPGRPLRSVQLMKPDMIQRNEQVTLIYEVPGISLTVRGKTTEGGAEGDVISVLNEQSKRTVQGLIVGPGRVLMDSRVPRIAANLPPSEPEAKDKAH